MLWGLLSPEAHWAIYLHQRPRAKAEQYIATLSEDNHSTVHIFKIDFAQIPEVSPKTSGVRILEILSASSLCLHTPRRETMKQHLYV